MIYPGALSNSRKLGEDIGCRFLASRETDYAKQQGAGGAHHLPMLSADDAAEVERLYQRLKSVGHIEPRSPEEQ